LLVPPGVVTVTSTLPVPAGAVAVIWLAERTVKAGARVVPKRTAVAWLKLLPVMVTAVPPPDDPEAGLTELITGGDAAVAAGAAIAVEPVSGPAA
jgi:hypothetical protein